MKYIFIAILFVHGIIHLFGFAKAFDLAQFEELKANISKLHGIFWFFAFVLFAYTGEAYISKNSSWHFAAIIAVTISLVLIIFYWKDAKFGTIPNLIIFLVALFSLSSSSFNKKTTQEVSSIFAQACTNSRNLITNEELNNLPYPVAKWLTRSGIVGKERIYAVHLAQKVRMKMNHEQKEWNEAVAEQYFTVENPAFIWKVNMDMSPFIKITGRDKFVDGKGEMQIKIFSLFNVVNEKGSKMNEATLQRYLAEIVWFPSAAISRYISWEAIDSLTSKATMNYKETTGSGTFYFNEQGDFIKFETLRYKGNDKRYWWRVKVKEHSTMNEIIIPTKMEASWMLENGEWTWLDLEITDIWYNRSIEIN
ncbi:MAG: hypothetical protein L3J41_17330 [Melioribacteraceae bacterium]|nr:hypothetical protein [Melioribacteraceae bacterium]